MSKRRRLQDLVFMIALFTFMFSTVAFAAQLGQGSDATVDILQGDRFGGAIQWVNTIGKFVDQWFMAAISFISFFIISASCLRNVLAGAYCVFPKFWDKVDEAHKASQGLSIAAIQSCFTGGGWKNTSSGSISQFLMTLLPNVKVLTDFENAQDVDYKQYFMRAIPQCVLAVFIGVFIYNGYYRDVMIVTSQFGSRMTLSALTSIDPDEIVYKMSNISGVPDYPIKGAKVGTDWYADTALTEIQKKIRNEFPDQSQRNNKSELYSKLSSVIASKCKAEFPAPLNNTDVWNPTKISSSGVALTVNDNTSEGYSTDNMTYTHRIKVTVGDASSGAEVVINTEYHKGEVWTAWADVVLKNKGASEGNTNAESAIGAVILTLPANKVSRSNGRTTIGWSAGNGTETTIVTNQNVKVDGTDASIGRTSIEIKGDKEFSRNTPIDVENMQIADNGIRSGNLQVSYIIFKDGISVPEITSNSLGVTVKLGESLSDQYKAKLNSGQLTTSPTTSGSGELTDEDAPD